MAAYTLSNKDIIKGGHLMVILNGAPIAFATSHSISKTLNTQEVSTKDHGDFSAVLPQNITWEITTENLYSLSGYDTLNNVFNSMTEVDLYFGETTYAQDDIETGLVGADPAKENWKPLGHGEEGRAYITSLQVTAGAGENATFSATFTGNGSLEADIFGPVYDITNNSNVVTGLPATSRPGNTVPFSINNVHGAPYVTYALEGAPSTGTCYYNGDMNHGKFTMPSGDVLVSSTSARAPMKQNAWGSEASYDAQSGSYVSVAYIYSNNTATGIAQLSYLMGTAENWVLVSDKTDLIEVTGDLGVELSAYSGAYTYAYAFGATGYENSYSTVTATYKVEDENGLPITSYANNTTVTLKQYLYRN